MRPSVRDFVPAAFLASCILLGGASAAGVFANALLQLSAIAILGSLCFARSRALVPAARAVTLGIAAFAAWLVVQLIPLPPTIWTRLPGRQIVVDGFALAGVSPGWAPLSLVPDATVAALLALLPPAAMAGLTLAATDRARRIAIATLIAVAIGAASLGVVQVLAGADSVLYPYQITSPGAAVGPFANRNHLATLLLCAIPFLAPAIGRNGIRRSGAALAGIVVLAGGVVLTGSDAGLGLLAVVLGFVAVRVAARRGVLRATGLRFGIVAVLGLVAVTAFVLYLAPPAGSDGAELRRGVSIPRTLAAAIDHLPFGAGGGSFPTIYPSHTDAALASPAFVNHAHSDYVELLLDHGIVGLALIVATWWWWARRMPGGAVSDLPDRQSRPLVSGAVEATGGTNETGRIGKRSGRDESSAVRAALVAVAVVLLHSLVDYPLRTAALAAVAAFAAALASGQPPADPAHRRPRRASRELSESFDLG